MRQWIVGLLLMTWQQVYAMTPVTYVIDLDAIANLEMLVAQLDEEFEVIDQQLKSIIGNYPYGDIYNGSSDKSQRVWAPNSIEEFEDMVKNGFNPGDLADRYAYYQEKFPSISQDEIEPKNPDSLHRDLYQYNEEWTKLNLVSFAQTFDKVNLSYDKINNLLAELNKHDTLKQSADFGNRLLGELAYLMQGLIQLQNFSLHTQTMIQQAEQHRITDHTRFFTFRKK